ncbi:DUF6063 family protein [Salicibibacter cibarius]
MYEETKILEAFQLYTVLARDGYGGREERNTYQVDDNIRSLVDSFAAHVECAVLTAGERIYMIPKASLSPFHMKNDDIKRRYLKAGATNADLYLMYVCVIIFFGLFYDSYQTPEPTRDFVRPDLWTDAVQERIQGLRGHNEEMLKTYESDFAYNWRNVIEKWEDMNDVKEGVKQQSGNTISRLSFIDTVRRFLIDQELAEDIGNDETALTEKAKTIVQRFFREEEYNRGILSFLYQWEREDNDAIDQ